MSHAAPSPGLDLDNLPAGAAITALAPLFEGTLGFLYRLVAARPFGTWARLFDRAREIAHQMPEPLQVELIEAHPRLGAPRDGLSTMSAREQGSAGEETADVLARLNAEYEARFGFRYCVFVAGRPLAALVPGFQVALAADREAERHRALDAVVDIARSRQAAAARERAAEGVR